MERSKEVFNAQAIRQGYILLGHKVGCVLLPNIGRAMSLTKNRLFSIVKEQVPFSMHAYR